MLERVVLQGGADMSGFSYFGTEWVVVGTLSTFTVRAVPISSV